jgi:hypothetical protein
METELQIELFKRDHDRVPATLDELVPEYTSAVPLDPLSGQPFLYRVEHGKHVLYSVGSDRQDDGGRFGGWSALQTDGFDVDIETVVRKQ